MRDLYLGVMGCKSTELESPSSTLLSGPYPLSFWVRWWSTLLLDCIETGTGISRWGEVKTVELLC